MCHISTTTDSPEPRFGEDLGWYLGYKWMCLVCPETKHGLRYLSHKTPIQTQTQIVIECSTQQPLHRLTPFLFVDIAGPCPSMAVLRESDDALKPEIFESQGPMTCFTCDSCINQGISLVLSLAFLNR